VRGIPVIDCQVYAGGVQADRRGKAGDKEEKEGKEVGGRWKEEYERDVAFRRVYGRLRKDAAAEDANYCLEEASETGSAYCSR
jgi:hypothetical protein